MPTRIAINGFGRIGRAVTRIALQRDTDIEIVAVNDVADPAALCQLLALDSVYGRFGLPLERTERGFMVAGREVRVLAEPEPALLPWEELDVDVVIEATGRFRTRAQAALHLDAGARKVILS